MTTLRDFQQNTLPQPTPAVKLPRKKTLVMTSASFMAAMVDMLALVLALYVSIAIGGELSQAFESTYIDLNYVLSTKRHQIYLALSVVILLMFYSRGHYTQRIPWWSQVQMIAQVMIYAVVIDGFMSFAAELRYSRLLILLNWGSAFLFILVGRQMVHRVQQKLGHGVIPTVIIGDSATVTDVLYALNTDRFTGYAPQRLLLRDKNHDQVNKENFPRQYRKIQIANGSRNLEHAIRAYRDHFFLVSFESFSPEARDQLIAQLAAANVLYAVIPSIKHMSLYEMEPRYFFGNDVMLLHVTPPMASPISSFLKRMLDIVVSAIALMLLSPLFLVAVLMLKFEGQGGSALYGGERIGKDARRFKCWKFRTMEPDSDHLLEAYLNRYPLARAQWNKYRKLPRDPRVTTHTARMIRKLSIDELPQLWNVLKGEMSLVGPRPILEEEVGYFGDRLDEYLSVKPGITGLWQVSGRNAVSFERRVCWDSWYVRNWSLWGDIVILLKTLPALMRRADAS